MWDCVKGVSTFSVLCYPAFHTCFTLLSCFWVAGFCFHLMNVFPPNDRSVSEHSVELDLIVIEQVPQAYWLKEGPGFDSDSGQSSEPSRKFVQNPVSSTEYLRTGADMAHQCFLWPVIIFVT